LGFIFKNCPSQIFTEDEKEQINFLVRRKEDLLRLEEEAWCLKSRAIWIRSGDRNTKKFSTNLQKVGGRQILYGTL
jgi:hypothetical protein